MSPFVTLVRSLTRHRLFAILNIGGLALGIAVFLTLFLYVRFETGYDKQLPGWNTLWLLEEQYTRPDYPTDPSAYTMGGELAELKGDFPDLVGSIIWPNLMTLRQGGEAISQEVAFVDPDFFRLFPFPALAGDPRSTLQNPDAIVVTETVAHKYFGDQPAIGRTLTLSYDGKDYSYRIGAVLRDPPKNMSVTSPIYIPMVESRFAGDFWKHWGSTSVTTILRFPDPAAAKAFEARLPGFLERHAYPDGNVKKETYHQLLIPFSDLHLIDSTDRTIMATLGLVGVLTLLIAVVNYVNLATARAGLRAREVALRKVLGGTRRRLIGQFMGEAVATVALATLIGLAMAELTLPFVNVAGGTSLKIAYLGANGILLPLLLLIVAVGGVAGVYPALMLSRFAPARVLASARAPGGGRAGARLRASLVVVQFAIAIAFAIATAVMLAQTAHVAHADVGFRRDGLVIVRSFTDDALDQTRRRQLLGAFARVRGVVSVGSGLNGPGNQFSTNSSTLSRPSSPTRNPNVSVVDVDPGYFATLGTRLLAGRQFDRDHADDRGAMSIEQRRSTPRNVILNQTAATMLGFATPEAAIGQTIVGFAGDNAGPGQIVGVVADQRLFSPREPVGPTAFLYTTGDIMSPFALVRYTGTSAPEMIAALEQAWRGVAPDVPFDARTAAQNIYQRFYKQDAQRTRLFTIGALLAVLIGCIGLYGLASFDTARRVKEIGIRKALGASTRDVLQLLLMRFLRPVVLANLIAWPLAYVAMRRWLTGFDDRIALSPLFFIGASLAAVAVACLTIFVQAWRVARAEPARALSHE